ncbi:MAG: hypothetical protein V3U27_12650, partial [Candidatus Tectomicrobia bacterium]
PFTSITSRSSTGQGTREYGQPGLQQPEGGGYQGLALAPDRGLYLCLRQGLFRVVTVLDDGDVCVVNGKPVATTTGEAAGGNHIPARRWGYAGQYG